MKNIVIMVLVFWIILKMKAENSSETLVASNNNKRYHSTNDPRLVSPCKLLLNCAHTSV